MRLAERAGLARPRYPLHRRRGCAAWPPQGRHLPLSDLEHDARLRPVPHHGAGGRRKSGWLGVDGSASNDNSNLMEGVRHALMLNRLTYDAAAVTHFDVLRWATSGSARCIGRDDIGTIAVGKQADLALYTLDELRFSGAGDPIA